MKWIYLVSQLVFMLNVATAQSFRILDKQTKEPIAFVHVLFYANDAIIGGVYSNSRGEVFNDLKDSVEQIKISHLSYRDTTLSISEIKEVLFLEQSSMELMSTTVFASNSNSSIFLGERLKRRRSVRFLIHSNNQFRMTTFIDNPFEVEKQLKSFVFYSKPQKNDKNTYFYKVIFFENHMGERGEKMPYEVVCSLSTEKNKKITVNLEEENIAIPSNGFFVGLEWIGLERNSKDNRSHKTSNFNKNLCRAIFLNNEKKKKSKSIFFTEKFANGEGWIHSDDLRPLDDDYVFLPAFGVEVFE